MYVGYKNSARDKGVWHRKCEDQVKPERTMSQHRRCGKSRGQRFWQGVRSIGPARDGNIYLEMGWQHRTEQGISPALAMMELHDNSA